MNERQALQRLSKAIFATMDNTYGAPRILGETEGFLRPTLCWDGPYDWTMITAGSSITAGETGDYSKPTEEKIATAIQQIENAGYYLEPVNAGQLVACKDW